MDPNQKNGNPHINPVALVGPLATKRRIRDLVESEIVPSDRMALVGEANRLVGTLAHKQIAVACHTSVPGEAELSGPENETYVAALGFLRDQFKRGANHAFPLQKRIEKESEAEYPPLASFTPTKPAPDNNGL